MKEFLIIATATAIGVGMMQSMAGASLLIFIAIVVCGLFLD